MTKRKGTLNVPCVYVVLRKKDKILFLLREYTGFMDGMYCLPSGHVEEGENFITAAIRETKEEVGVTVARGKMRPIYTMHRQAASDIRIDLFFEADEWQGEPSNKEPHKHSGIAWFSLKDMVKQPIMDYQATVLEAIIEGSIYSEWGWPEGK